MIEHHYVDKHFYMKMTPEMIPAVQWVPCQDGLPAAGTFVWIVVGKIIEAGVARRYPREVHMGAINDEGKFQIYPYRLPLLSNHVWAWAAMVPPSPPQCKALNSKDDKAGEEWKEIEVDEDDDGADPTES